MVKACAHALIFLSNETQGVGFLEKNLHLLP